MSNEVLELDGVGCTLAGNEVLRGIDWRVESGQRWVVLGLNGSGKTTLIRIASMWLHPSTGSVSVLGETLGRTDVRRLRERVGLASASMADLLRPELMVRDVVKTARHAALEPWWHEYSDADDERANTALEQVGIGHLADRRFGVCSSGERQRVLLARALSIEPGVILLDEPTAALDLAGREELLASLGDLAADPNVPPVVLVTHHVEEIPTGFTHALMLRDGAEFCQGALTDVLTAENLSGCFGLALGLEQRHGRWSAWAL